MASALTHAPTALLRYVLQGEDGLADVAERLHEAAHDRPGGKFGKDESLYLPQSPFPPLLWRPKCERCRFYEDGAPGDPAMCHIVGREGDRWGGEAIHPRGWCAYYLPPEGEPAFEWFRERLDPSGAETVRGEYRPPLGERGVDTTPERGREVPVTPEGHSGEADGGRVREGEDSERAGDHEDERAGDREGDDGET